MSRIFVLPCQDTRFRFSRDRVFLLTKPADHLIRSTSTLWFELPKEPICNFPTRNRRHTVSHLLRYVFLILLIAPKTLWPIEAEAAHFPSDIRQIKERGLLKVAQYHGNRFPFFYRAAEGDLQGFDVELAGEIARELGVELEILKTPRTFNEVAAIVASGEADLGISELSITLERGLSVLFAGPYVTLHKGLLINRLEAARADRGMDPFVLCNHPEARIGVLQGTSHADSALEFCPRAGVVPYGSFEDLLEAVQLGEVLAIVSDDMKIKTLLNEDPTIVLKLRMVILKDELDPLGIAVRPDAPHLQKWLELFLTQRRIDHDTDSLLDLYRHQERAALP